jgi:hypothetical protein
VVDCCSVAEPVARALGLSGLMRTWREEDHSP